MRTANILIIPLLFFACEGPVGPDGVPGADGTNGVDGQTGEQGIQGEPGPGTRIVYSGMIASNDMIIVVPEMNIVDPPSIDVLLCPSGFGCFPTPIFFTVDDVRFETWFTTNDQFVELFNALAFSGDNATYAIIVIE